MSGFLLALGLACFGQEKPPVGYQEEVLPLLADKCFVCHGPDAEARKAGLRLDSEEHARASGVLSGEHPILLERVQSNDSGLRMPPPDFGIGLTTSERELLERWVAEGARFEALWSFESLPDSVPVPRTAGTWAKDDLDHFVWARMRANGLSPSPAASPERWLRRVTLDLTGLPPTLDDLDAFLVDSGADARAKVVDRLLATTAFGEHMAIPWLDVARYADSYGYQSDLLSLTWPFRDWVVEAFRSGMPYDRFLTEQLAGDLLPNPLASQRLATAFNRLHRMTNEGGSLDEEWRVEYVADRVDTLGTAVLGLSLECARCHDHKYDPITQRDYYSLFAYFNSIDEAGLYIDDVRVPTPSVLLPDQEQQIALDKLRDLPASAFPEPEGLAREASGEVARFMLRNIGAKGKLANAKDPKQSGRTQEGNRIVVGDRGPALLLTGDDPVGLGDFCNNFPPGQPFTLALWVRMPEDLKDGMILHRSTGLGDGYYGMEMALRQGKLFFAFKRFWPGNALAVESDVVPTGEWVHLVAINRGSYSADGMRVFVNGVESSHVLKDNLTKLPDVGAGQLILGFRNIDTGLRDTEVLDVRVFDKALSAAAVARLYASPSPGWEGFDARPVLSKLRQGDGDPVLNRGEIARREAILRLQSEFVEVPVMEELPEARPAHVLARGAYDAPRTEANRAERRPPEALAGGGDEVRSDRLGLAQWLTSPEHPLTARVAVNRFWAQFFHRGLVSSLDDFGVQGDAPSHPLLLDYLALEFIQSNWDVKALCRRLVLSATYGQDSAGSRTKDPDNRWLARGPSTRLSAEALRDTALMAAGLLSFQVGGPPVSPYQPQGLWRESNRMTPAYEQGQGDDLVRRSLYTVWKRTSPMPNMSLFDSPGRERACAQRQVTNTPLQALVLLNDVQFVEAARVMAENERLRGLSIEESIEGIFRRLTSRRPNADEQAILTRLYRNQLELFQQDPQSARSLRSVGMRSTQAGLRPIPLAALTVVAQAILSMDATVWKR